MKKIVIVTRRMIMGGVEKALIAMLNSIPKDQYEVTVLLMGMGGELEEDIPEHVIVEPLFGYENSIIEKIWNYCLRGRFIQAFKTGFYTIKARFAKSIYEQELLYSKRIGEFSKDYDIAIAYHVPASFPVQVVMNNIKAKMKIAWIHSDVSQYQKELIPYLPLYENFDKIFCVSEYGMKIFNEQYPHLKNKTALFYNMFDEKQMILMANHDNGFIDEFKGIRILTIGRLSREKGQDIIPGTLKRLKEEGFNIRWYCIGDGSFSGELKKLIENYELKENLILLGTKKNPYSFIKQCDIYVQPSRHEGYCISLAEARAFNKPIITTNFVGAREQIIDGETGVIINFDENQLYHAIKTLVNNYDLCKKFERNLKSTEISTSYEISKLFDCFV
ncbi:glycosyltransferase [Lederbergia panacisoli]|uniref:glycosyltransferase n=1 Tax=Lederbergia panacisoli TaxID=1255251 RepID=UPI00214BE623|nr:glycosyltransferase [Lederbergia panacisoli]MCR2822020.1 glycosyltransferase [Lederbergia panacisoli]